MFPLVFFLFSLTLAQTCTKSRVVACALTYVDTDSNGRITQAELDDFIMEGPCGPIPAATGAGIVQFCDFNGDGELTAVEDIDPPDAPCLYSEPLMKMVCEQCDKCDAMK